MQKHKEKTNNILNELHLLAQLNLSASRCLQQLASENQKRTILLQKLQKISQDAANKYQNILARCSRQFILPLAREDIMLLGYHLQSLTFAMHRAGLLLVTANNHLLSAEIEKLTEIINDFAKLQIAIINELQKPKKAPAIATLITKSQHLQKAGETIYFALITKRHINVSTAAFLNTAATCLADYEQILNLALMIKIKNN